MKLSGVEKAAILLSTVGPEAAAAVLKHLGEVEIRLVTQGIASLRLIPWEAAAVVHEEFYSRLTNRERLYVNGERIAQTLIAQAGDPAALEERHSPFTDPAVQHAVFMAFVERLSKAALLRCLRNEHPQIIAFALANLRPPQAAEVFLGLPEEVQTDVLARIADLDAVSPDMLGVLNDALQAEARNTLQKPATSLGGTRAAAEIMNRLDREPEARIFATLDETNPGLAAEIRDCMLMVEDLVKLDNREMQHVLREISHKDLILAMKAASHELQAHIFANLSKRAATNLREDMETTGPVELRHVKRAQGNIVAEVRRLQQQSKVSIGGRDDEVVV
jgi:flagellar motor switch protein FliG